jgi:hypothetical protein
VPTVDRQDDQDEEIGSEGEGFSGCHYLKRSRTPNKRITYITVGSE